MNMKAIILFVAAATLSLAAAAQADSSRMKKVNGIQKSTVINPHVVVRGTANLPVKAAAISQGPDLAITAFSVKKLPDVMNNGEVMHKLEIDCTIKNTGPVSIAAKNISLDGQVSFDPQHTTGIAGCGTVLSTLSWEELKPGDSYSRTYYCTLRYDAAHPAYYNLKITLTGASESNVQNNVAQASIPY